MRPPTQAGERELLATEYESDRIIDRPVSVNPDEDSLCRSLVRIYTPYITAVDDENPLSVGMLHDGLRLLDTCSKVGAPCSAVGASELDDETLAARFAP